MGATLERRGLMLVLSSPSGAGKSTIARRLLYDDNAIRMSVSATTRARRGSEVDGRDYHFVDPDRFRRMVDRGDLLEWAEVHGNLYGTPKEPVEAALQAGRDVLFDIDWQGTRQLAASMPDDLVSIFVLPPSMGELRARLQRRAEDSPATIDQRLGNARLEIEQWRAYDYCIVNEDVERAFETVRAILVAERVRRTRVRGLDRFVNGLLAEPDAVAR